MDRGTGPEESVSLSSAGSRGRVLITQFPDDESVRTSHSDLRSEGGATLHSHFIETPIPEEEEEGDEEDGRFSRKSEHSQNGFEDMAPSPLDDKEAGRRSDLLKLRSRLHTPAAREARAGGSEEDEEGDGSDMDSMSVDNLSEAFSASYGEPPELRDEDFDTDLDMDDDRWLHPEKYDHDTTGLTKYLTACEEHDVTPVRYFIKHMLDVDMNLGHHGLGPAAIKALAVPLESNTSIERLDLEGNWIEDEGVVSLCRVLKENVYIVQLNLGENKMGNNGAHCVLNLLEENRTIDWLDLTGNCITDTSGEALCQMLKRNTTLRHLKLRHNELGDRGAQWLKEALAENESLETLDVSWNHFQTKGCVLLADGVKENVCLKEINLSMNGFGLEGAIGLGEAIKINRTLQKLDTSYCRLPVEGAVSLANGLQANETLQSLKVGYNSLGPEGTLALLLGLDRNDCSALLLLDLGNCRVTSQFKQLQDKLETERSLTVIHGGVMLESLLKEVHLSPADLFKRDPMTKLKEWVEQAGYRLIDLLRHFDKDNSMTISRQEFVDGIKSTRIAITDEQIEILLERLDTDGDGEIDFSELVQCDNDHRSLKRDILRYEEEQRQSETDLDSFIRNAAT